MFKLTLEKKNNTNKRKTETSKVLLLSVIILTYAFTLFVCFMVYKTQDLSPLSYLIPSIFGLSTTAVGFYSWKAKKENLLKIGIQKIKEEEKLKKQYNKEDVKINLEEKESNVENYGIYNEFNDGGIG